MTIPLMTANILIIESRFYEDITDQLVLGALRVLAEAGAGFRRLEVPGILEIPAALACAVEAGMVGGFRPDGFVTFGCAVKGGTDHYDHVCREAMRGVQDLAIAHRLAVGNGILTVHSLDQARERAGVDRRDFGGQVTRACLRMIDIKREIGL